MKRFFITCICLIILLSGTHYVMAYEILVYDPDFNTNYHSGAGDIQLALNKVGLNYDLRSWNDPVTPADLQTHSVLIVGWSGSDWGDYSGLYNIDIETYITGNILLTGHDPDFHYANGFTNGSNTTLASDKSEIIGYFLQQLINFGQAASGTGLVVLSDWSELYYWLPSSYDIIATETISLNSDVVTSITSDGMASSIYDNLSAEDMSGWINSYHTGFLSWDSSFKAFEIGETFVLDDEAYTPAVTIARTVPEPTTLLLLGLGLIGLATARRKL